MIMIRIICLFCLALCNVSASAQNLYQPVRNPNAALSGLSTEAVIELHNSIYYLTISLDSPAAAAPSVSYYFSRVDARTGTLQKTVLLLSDTVFNGNESFQPSALSYCVNATGTCFNFFTLADADSSQKYWFYSSFWRYPKSVGFFQLDTGLTETVPRKKILDRQPFSRYALWYAGPVTRISETACAFMYIARDTLLDNSGFNVSGAAKVLIIDDTGKVLSDKFLGYEPIGTGTYFPDHFSEYLYKLPPPDFFGARVSFQDSIFEGQGPKLMLLDSNLDMYDTVDCPDARPFERAMPGKKNVSFMGLATTFFCLPSGSLCCYSIGEYTDSLHRDSTYDYYALAKGSLRPGYNATALYFPPKANGGDHFHSASEAFPGALYNAFDNLIYSFSATEAYPAPPYYCMNGQPNLGQLVCVDTNLQEQWVKYVHAKPGYCVQTFGVYQPQGRPGVIISGRIFKLDAPGSDSLWEDFIYYVDSTTQLGLHDPDNPLVITNQFSLYPNPAQSELVIENALGSAYEYVVMSMTGSVVARGKGHGTKTMLHVASLASGIYNIHMFEASTKRVFTLRFLRP